MQRDHANRVLTTAALAAALLAGGCNLFDRTAPTSALYLLDPPAQARREGAPLGALTVRRFSASQPFDGTTFVYRLADGSWSRDAYDGFAADPASMLTGAAVDAFDASGRFGVVAREGLAARSELALDGVVEAFYADFPREPAAGTVGEAVVRLRIYLSSRASGDAAVVFSTVAEGRAPIANRASGDVAASFSAASAQALGQALDALPPAVRSQKAG
jgi:ABC-type uncharacterized transport system auxiliary subunit